MADQSDVPNASSFFSHIKKREMLKYFSSLALLPLVKLGSDKREKPEQTKLTGLTVEKATKEVSSLPEELSDPDNLGKVRKAVTQWSKLVPWSWSSYLAFADDPQKAEEEKKLKVFFIKTLQTQAQHLSAFTAYKQMDSKEIADNASENFKYILGGQNDKLKEKGITLTLTLSDVLKKLTDEDFIFTVDQKFLDKFRFEVIANAYSGSIREDQENPGKYISVMTYPAAPAFSEATVTEAQLMNWMTTSGDGEYLPPSVYIPLSAS